MRYIFLTLALFSLFACNSNRKYLIPEKDFVEILVDIHLAEALFSVTRIKQQSYPYHDTLDIYDSVIIKHGYTVQQYDSTLAYHSKNPAEFQELYDKVIEELNRLEGESLEELKQGEQVEEE